MVSSWVHNGKLYYFGGMTSADSVPVGRGHHYPSYLTLVNNGYATGYTNQLFCYNPNTDMWEWPLIVGDISSPRYDSSIIIN